MAHDDLKRMLDEDGLTGERGPEPIERSPARKETGRVRNIERMRNEKLLGLAQEMRDWNGEDREAQRRIDAELKKRGLS